MHQLHEVKSRVLKGGGEKYHAKNKEAKKLFARRRIELLCDKDSFIEDGMFANCLNPEFPSDGVITGLAKISGRTVAIMANDSTIKAGSWGARTVEKIVRIQETAEKLLCPLFYLVDSAGARLTDQVDMFPGRRHAGRIFRNEVHLSGRVPQICLLFGPSAAGGAYIPAFCDVVFMNDGNASMYLGSPRMAEMVIGEKVSLEEMGGAKMHCSVSGCGDFLCTSEEETLEKAKRYFSYFPQNWMEKTAVVTAVDSEKKSDDIKSVLPEVSTRAYDMRNIIKCIIDKDSFFEVKELYAKELITGFARLGGHSIGIVANQPLIKGGVLFVESSDKAARFIQICNAYSIPLLFLADVPGFMVGSKVEKEGMIRAGAKMIHAVSSARVPKISVIVRKAYGAGLYAMCGPSYDTDAVLALPTANIAVMGPEPAINAVYFNKIAELSPEEKKKFMQEKIAEYNEDIDLFRLAGELIIDHVIDFKETRDELIKRFDFYRQKKRGHHGPSTILPM